MSIHSMLFAEAPLFGSETPAANASPCAPDVERTVSFRSWAMKLAPLILRARAPFSSFLCKTLHLQLGSRSAPAHALFPLPVPFPGVFRRCDPQLGSRARGKVAVKRAAHVAVMALNYLHNNLLPLACCGGGPTLHKEGPLTSFIGFVGRAVPSRISRFPRPGAVILNYLQDLGSL